MTSLAGHPEALCCGTPVAVLEAAPNGNGARDAQRVKCLRRGAGDSKECPGTRYLLNKPQRERDCP